CLVLSVPYILLYAFAGGGAGDAKLMAAVGVWLGLSNAVVVLVAVSLSGAVIGLALAVHRNRLRPVLSNMTTIAMSAGLVVLGRARAADAQSVLPRHEAMLGMAYGVAICAGVCLAAVGKYLCQ